MNTAQRMKERRKELGISADDIAEKIGVSRSTIFRYENGYIEKMPIEILKPLSEILKTSPEYLMGLKEKSDIESLYNQLVPPRQEKVYQFAEHQLEQQQLEEDADLYVVGQTAAGEPIEGQQAVPFIGAETLNLLVNGDSMEPRFYDGDIIRYHPQPQLENGEIGVFTLNGGITLKRFKNNGDIRLQSLNEKYEDIVVKEKDEFSILGKALDKKKKSYE